VHADYLAALGIDDLLVKQVARHAQHVFIGMVGRQAFVLEMNAFGGDGLNLIVANGEQPGPGADEIAIDANGVNERDDGGVFERTDEAALQVVDFLAEEFGEIEDFFDGHEFSLRGAAAAATLVGDTPESWPSRYRQYFQAEKI